MLIFLSSSSSSSSFSSALSFLFSTKINNLESNFSLYMKPFFIFSSFLLGFSASETLLEMLESVVSYVDDVLVGISLSFCI